MLKRIALLSIVVPLLCLTFVVDVSAKTITGRITTYSSNSISVRDLEMRSPVPIGKPAAAFAAPQAATSAPATTKSKSSALLTSSQVKALIATAKTPADHAKLQKHFLALAAKYDADAAEHAAEASAYR